MDNCINFEDSDLITVYNVAMELPHFLSNIPNSLESVMDGCSAKWVYEFLGNSYLHWKGGGYCGQSYADVMASILYSIVFESIDCTNTLLYGRAMGAVKQMEEFIKIYEKTILAHFDRIGVEDDLLEYVSVVCDIHHPIAYWKFYRSPF